MVQKRRNVMAGFTLFNHRQICSLVLSATLVFTLSSSAWAKNDHGENGRGNQHDSRLGTANGDGSVGVMLRKAIQKSESYQKGNVPSQKGNQHDSRMGTTKGAGSVGTTLRKAIQKNESYKKRIVPSRGHVGKLSPQAHNRPHVKQDYYKKREWKHWSREYGRSPWQYNHRPRYGSIHRVLPSNHFRLFLGGVPFFYAAGVYFQPGSQGYVVVPPPLGIRVQVLPEGCSPFYYGDRRYYSCGDVFYEERGAEYVVINRPASYRLIADAGDEVEINTSALNMRSGPGFKYETLTTLHQGEIAEVDAVDGDWYYVILEDGSHGWIKRQYTRIISFKEDPKG
jgi:uncharacterized protein YraI